MARWNRLRSKKNSLETEEGFTLAFRRCSEPILLYLSRATMDPHLAADLTAETFARALEDAHRFTGETLDEERAWLFGITKNVLRQHQRDGAIERRAVERLKLAVPALAPDDISEIERRAGLEQLRQACEHGLGSLRNGHREAIRLRVIEELAYPEVAARLEISEDNARARVSRGLRALGELLEAQSQEEIK